MSIELKENSAIQNHINILQNVISRMANNSSNSKTWAITVISAIIVLLIDKSKTNIYYIAYIPLVMFYFLDCFYLGLERYFRSEYNTFVINLESGKFDISIVYKVKGPEKMFKKIFLTLSGAWSFSTSPFYIILGLLVFIISKIV